MTAENDATEDLRLRRDEYLLRARELELKEEEARLRSHWRSNPVAIAVVGAILAIIGGIITSFVSARTSARIERQRAEANLILEAVKTGDRQKALKNLKFFLDMGLLTDASGPLRAALEHRPESVPVLPSTTGNRAAQDRANAWAARNCPPGTTLRTDEAGRGAIGSWWCEDATGAREGPYLELYDDDPTRVARRGVTRGDKPSGWTYEWNSDGSFRKAECAADGSLVLTEAEARTTPCPAPSGSAKPPAEASRDEALSTRFPGAYCSILAVSRLVASCGYADEASCRAASAIPPNERHQEPRLCERRPNTVFCLELRGDASSETRCYAEPERCAEELARLAPPGASKKPMACRHVELGSP